MRILSKKSSLLSSAFLFVAVATLPTNEVAAAVQCSGNSFTGSVSRSDLTGADGVGSDRTVSLVNQQSGALVNQAIDLNIQSDISSLGTGQVTAESADWVWRLEAENKDKIRGDIVADYQFNSVGGAGKVCSSVNSCLDILNVRTNVTYERRKNGRVTLAEGRVVLTLDASQASEAGSYRANVTVSLHQNSTANPSLCQ